MSDKSSADWYCPTCNDYVSGESVTFEEVHVICGTFIGEVWQKTKAALEQRVERLERQTRLMAGALSTYGPYTNKHPEEVLDEFEALAALPEHLRGDIDEVR